MGVAGAKGVWARLCMRVKGRRENENEDTDEDRGEDEDEDEDEIGSEDENANGIHDVSIAAGS